MLQVIETLFPIVFAIVLGMLLTKRGFLSETFLTDLNQFIFWVGLPLMIVKSLASAESFPSGTFAVFGVFLIASLVLTLIAWFCIPVLGLSRFQRGAYLQGTFRGNLAFIAIPIILFAMRKHSSADIDQAMTLAIFVFAPSMIYYNVVSVLCLMQGQGDQGLDWGKTTRSILTNPLIISSLIGCLFFILPFELPPLCLNTMAYIGNISGPAALLCVGGGMAQAELKGQWQGPLGASILKVFVLPLLAYAFGLCFELSEISIFVLLVLAASPTAVASYVVTKAMNGDESLASSTIVISTLLSIVSLSLVVGLATPSL